jgi:hypothetical protein
MKKYFIIFCFLIFGPITYGQSNTIYKIDVELNPEDQTLLIRQKVEFINNSKFGIDKLFFEDWSNSYSNTDTKLAKRISDEYSRSFSFSKKRQRGYTTINELYSENLEEWKRLEDSDIIELKLSKPLLPNESIEIIVDYSIKLPDSRFTGFGYDDDNFYLKNWIIVLSSINKSKWTKQNNLNLDDQSINFSDYHIVFKIKKDYKLFSNLDKLSEDLIKDQKIISLSGINKKEIKINILKEDVFLKLENKGIITETDIFKLSSISDTRYNYNRISEFISNYFVDNKPNKFMVSKNDYDLSPFYGLNQLPRFLSPFPDDFLEEIVFLKSFTMNYLNSIIDFNKREFHWIYKGLEIYLIDKYIKSYYPRAKFIGYYSGNRLLKNYEISKINFTDLFLNYSEYIQRLNIHQSDILPSDKLTRINEEIASPYHAGIGLIYLENLIGEDQFRSLIQKIVNIKSNKELYEIFNEIYDYDLGWFLEDYIGKRQSIDLKIQKTDNNLFKITEKNNIQVPYSISFIKNDSIISRKFFTQYNEIEKPKIEFDYVAINHLNKLPELNRNNNYIHNSDNKPVRIRLISDLDDPKKRNLYFRPEITYNLYDGLSPGINFSNRGIKNKPFSYEIFSQYASKEKTLVGSLNLNYQVNNEINDNFSTVYNIFYKTNHYNEDLRFQVFSPSITVNFRDNNNLRSNIRRSFSISMYSVDKDSNNVNDNKLNNYSIYNLGYYYSDIDIIKYLKSSVNTEFSNNFGKINLVFDYRKIFNSNRQFQARVYLGKFFWNNRNFENFNYNLGRSGGYLFLDNYLGRSERTGLLSQQFIMAGGGFKSFFDNPTTDNFMLTTNLNIGLWKWIEGYLDLGMLKDKGKKSRHFYGTGLRLNLLPDFFELYFPISSSNGFELSQKSYSNKIRFIVSYNLESLGNLFSRRWL